VHTATHPPDPPIPPVPVLTGLGQALRWLRERQARKQYQVAAAAGITKGMLSAYETGRQRPSLETLDKLLDTLGCDLNDLHNALQIVNGRPEQMKGWHAATRDLPVRADVSGVSQGIPGGIWTYPSMAVGPAALAGEVHEPARGHEGLATPATAVTPATPATPATLAMDELRQVLGVHAPVDSIDALDAPDSPDSPNQGRAPAAPGLPLPQEEALALAQMLEGFHNLLRYWHRCLTVLAAARAGDPAKAPNQVEPPGKTGGAPGGTGRPEHTDASTRGQGQGGGQGWRPGKQGAI
jgi:DNA-binding XRE family transcriptional regulator